MALSPSDRDILIRTALGEVGDGSDDDVANVAREAGDLLAKGGSVFERGRYDSWGKSAKRLLSIKPESKAYQRVAQIVDKATSSDASDPAFVLGLFGFDLSGRRIGAPVTSVPAAPPPAPATSRPPETEFDPASIFKLFGHDVDVGKMPPTAAAPGQEIRPRPEIREAAKVVSASRGIVQPFVQGIPIVGPGIEAASSVGAAAISPLFTDVGNKTFAERYRDYLDITHAAAEQYGEKYPGRALAGNITGSIAALGPLAATPLGGVALGLRGPTLGARFYAGGAGGATLSVIDALMRGENPAQAGFFGGAAGGFGPLASETVRTGVNLFGRPVPALRPYNAVVRNALTAALEGETPASIAEGMRRMGRAGFFADINTGLTDIAGGVADIPGPGKQIVREAYRTRVAAAGQRIDTAITQAMGPPSNIVESKQFLTEARKAAADPLYDQWRSMQVHPTPEIKALIPRLEEAGAFAQAQKISGITGEPITRSFFTGGPSKQFPTTQTWDYVKRGLDSKIDQAYASGDKTLARHLIDLRSDLISQIERTNAGQVWRQARSEFADRSALIDQIDRGRDTFLGSRAGLSVDELREELRGLSGPELAARIQGARAAISEAMRDSIRGNTQMRDKLLAPNNQDKLRLLLEADRADRLIADLESERFLAAQDVNVRGGSQTTPKKERVNALSLPPLPQYNPSLTQPLTWIPPHVLDQLRPTSVIEGFRGQRSANALQDLAHILTTTNRPEMADLINAISAESARRSALDVSAQRAGRAFGVVPFAGGSVLRLQRPNAQIPALVAPAQ